jgi:hypothetical protein
MAGIDQWNCMAHLLAQLRISTDPAPQSAPLAPETETKIDSQEGKIDILQHLNPRAPKDPTTDTFSAIRSSDIQRLHHYVAAEEDLMLQVVRTLPPQHAEYWLSTFISKKPFGCPPKQQQMWTNAIMSAVERNRLPLCKEILALVASIISIESSFRADPLIVDPSKSETVADMVQRAENELLQKFGVIMSVPPVPNLYNMYKDRYYQRIIDCKTEGDAEKVARSIAEDLKRDSAVLPEFVRTLVLKEIDKVSNVVRTKGSMQLNFPRAKQVMKERGEEFTDQELSDYMYTVEGGVDVGVAAIRPIFVQYAAYFAQQGTLSWLFFVGMDYNYGPFTSRNMMEQIRIRDLSGRNIAVDGDFLQYNEKGNPEKRYSETLEATASIFPRFPKPEIFHAFLLEKDPHYIYTDLHRLIDDLHRERFGETPFAVVGELWMGENAKIKHGTTWKTQAYLNKLDKYLNAVPWDNQP